MDSTICENCHREEAVGFALEGPKQKLLCTVCMCKAIRNGPVYPINLLKSETEPELPESRNQKVGKVKDYIRQLKGSLDQEMQESLDKLDQEKAEIEIVITQALLKSKALLRTLCDEVKAKLNTCEEELTAYQRSGDHEFLELSKSLFALANDGNMYIPRFLQFYIHDNLTSLAQNVLPMCSVNIMSTRDFLSAVFNPTDLQTYLNEVLTQVNSKILPGAENLSKLTSLGKLREKVKGVRQILETVQKEALSEWDLLWSRTEAAETQLSMEEAAAQMLQKEQLLLLSPISKTKSDVEEIIDMYLAQASKGSGPVESVSAIVMLKKALKLQLQYTPQDTRTATTYQHMAEIFQKKGRFDNAEECYTLALGIWCQFSPNSLEMAGIYNTLGHMYKDMQRFQHAKEAYRCALFILNACVGETSETAATYNSLGYLSWTMEAFPESEGHLKAAFRIWKAQNDPRAMSLAYEKLCKVYEKTGKQRELQELVKQNS